MRALLDGKGVRAEIRHHNDLVPHPRRREDGKNKSWPAYFTPRRGVYQVSFSATTAYHMAPATSG